VVLALALLPVDDLDVVPDFSPYFDIFVAVVRRTSGCPCCAMFLGLYIARTTSRTPLVYASNGLRILLRVMLIVESRYEGSWLRRSLDNNYYLLSYDAEKVCPKLIVESAAGLSPISACFDLLWICRAACFIPKLNHSQHALVLFSQLTGAVVRRKANDGVVYATRACLRSAGRYCTVCSGISWCCVYSLIHCSSAVC